MPVIDGDLNFETKIMEDDNDFLVEIYNRDISHMPLHSSIHKTREDAEIGAEKFRDILVAKYGYVIKKILEKEGEVNG